MKNYFSVLGIPEGSSESEIRKSFRALAKKYHPDINKAADAQEKFIEISEAYEFLINRPHPYSVTQKNHETVPSDHSAEEYYERIRREANERARQHARKKYEEFKREHEAFQQSGLDDLALIAIIISRAAMAVLFLYMVVLPFIMAFRQNWKMIFMIFVTWPFAAAIAWFIYNRRKNYFLPRKFYYNFERIRKIFSDVHPSTCDCFYCPSRKADSKPYRVDLLKLKDVKLQNNGPRQHIVNYVNNNIEILVPRSRKALILHTLNIAIRIASIVLCAFLLNISSVTWRIIAGMAIGGLLNSLLLVVMRTKSSISYLLSPGSLVRAAFWLSAIILTSDFSVRPFDITTNDAIHFVIVSIFLFDCLLMQLMNLILGQNSSKPLARQYEAVAMKFSEGYRVYNDIPVISAVYPLIKWIFG